MYDVGKKAKIRPLQLLLSTFTLMTLIWLKINPITAYAFKKLLYNPPRSNLHFSKNSLSVVMTSVDDIELFIPKRARREPLPPGGAPLYVTEGVFAVYKPLEWTSSDVVTYIRKMLERNAVTRGFVVPQKRGRKPLIKCGHGGTLDPLATGVLVIGVGRGTKDLQK
jgi:hypothetical protein